MPSNSCLFCFRDWTGSDSACTHCAAIRYLVWDCIGGKDTPSPEDYRQWAESPDGGVVERRMKRYFASRWTDSDGTVRRVPRVA